MYRAFNVAASFLNGNNHASILLEAGRKTQEEHARNVRMSLESVLNEKIIDGKKLTEHWFPEIEADVFICHSHNDLDKAIMWAGLLSTVFALRPFVDSTVWQYADDLLKIIDNKFCKIPGKESYSYEERNLSTSHVHAMLSIALTTMLDSTECVFFLNTPNSIASGPPMFRTESPWLFFELNTINVLRRRNLRNRQVMESFSKKAAASLLISHPVPLGELTRIENREIAKWIEVRGEQPQKHALDLLYEITVET
jgi:hypothetical protein